MAMFDLDEQIQHIKERMLSAGLQNETYIYAGIAHSGTPWTTLYTFEHKTRPNSPCDAS